MSFKSQPLFDYNSFIALDIGSFRTKALVCSIENGELQVISHASTRQSRKHLLSGEIADIAGVAETAKRTILKAAEKLDALPQEIVLSANSASLLYDSIGMNYVRTDPERPIDMEEIDRMIASTEGKSLDRMKPKSEARLGLPHTELRLVTTSLTSISIDGKKVSNPLGFTGKNVKLNLINFFIPSTTFASLSMVVRDLGMRLVSIIPSAVALPKILEDSPDGFDSNVIVDFGHSKTTIIVQNRSEILGADVLNFGYELLENMIAKEFSHMRAIDIEDVVLHPKHRNEKHIAIFQRFYSILFDSIRVCLTDIAPGIEIRNCFLSGWGNNEALREFLRMEWAHVTLFPKNIESLASSLPPSLDSSYTASYALAISAKELISIKKDPIARILRYVIYRHE